MTKFNRSSTLLNGIYPCLTPACLTLATCFSSVVVADDSSVIELEAVVVTATMSARPIGC